MFGEHLKSIRYCHSIRTPRILPASSACIQQFSHDKNPIVSGLVMTIKIIQKLNKKKRNTNFLITQRKSERRVKTFSCKSLLTDILFGADDEVDKLRHLWFELGILGEPKTSAIVM